MDSEVMGVGRGQGGGGRGRDERRRKPVKGRGVVRRKKGGGARRRTGWRRGAGGDEEEQQEEAKRIKSLHRHYPADEEHGETKEATRRARGKERRSRNLLPMKTRVPRESLRAALSWWIADEKQYLGTPHASPGAGGEAAGERNMGRVKAQP